MTLPAPQGSVYPPPRLRVIESGVGSAPRVIGTPVPGTTVAGSVTQLPAQINIVTYAGDDLAFELPITDSEGAAVDMTSATILAQIRQRPETPDPPAASFTSSVNANVITLSLPGSASQSLNGAYVWDCQITLNSKVWTPAAGAITITHDVSYP